MQLIELLRRVYENQTDELVAEGDEEQLWHEIQHSFVASQVYHLLRSRGLLETIPSGLRERLKQMADVVLYNNLFIRGEMNKLLRLFEAAGIEAIPLKGIRFSERYFGHFAARGTSDIDLLIRPSELARAGEMLTREGFIKEGEVDASHFHQLFTRSYENASFPFLSIELHWGVLRSHISDTRTEPLWNKAEPYETYGYVKELPVDQTFYHICLHGFNHQLMGMKYILDIAHLLYTRHKEIDYGMLMEQAKQDHNQAKVLIVLTHVYDLFPSLHHIKPLPGSRRWPFWNVNFCDLDIQREKGLQYYLFRMAAPAVTYDTRKQQLADFRYSWFPPRDFALAMVKLDPRAPAYRVYGKLYWNRLRQIWKSRLTKRLAKVKL